MGIHHDERLVGQLPDRLMQVIITDHGINDTGPFLTDDHIAGCLMGFIQEEDSGQYFFYEQFFSFHGDLPFLSFYVCKESFPKAIFLAALYTEKRYLSRVLNRRDVRSVERHYNGEAWNATKEGNEMSVSILKKATKEIAWQRTDGNNVQGSSFTQKIVLHIG